MHVKKKFKHLKNLKLADSNSNNENSCVDILIGSDFLWDIFESQIIRREPAMSTAMKTKFGYVLSGPISKVQNNEGSSLICHSLKCPTENSDNILQKKIENFWEIKRFDLKLTTPVFIKVFVRIFVTIQSKPYIKFDCSLQMIMKFYRIILHIASID